MTKILFVCHGNICRSPMAEFMLKDLVKKRGMERDFLIASSATSAEEIGNPVHPGTASRLAREGISTAGKYAVQLKRTDYDRYDYFLGMDQWNIRNMKRILGGDPENKVHLLLDFTGRPGEEIADPWYTGDFERTYADILEGCTGFLRWRGRGHRLQRRTAVPRAILEEKRKMAAPDFRGRHLSQVLRLFKLTLAQTTHGADPVGGDILPGRAGSHAVVGASHGRVIFIAAGADILIHHDRSFLRDRGSAKVALQQALERLAAAGLVPGRLSSPDQQAVLRPMEMQ